MNKRYYEHTLPIIRGSLSNTYPKTAIPYEANNKFGGNLLACRSKGTLSTPKA